MDRETYVVKVIQMLNETQCHLSNMVVFIIGAFRFASDIVRKLGLWSLIRQDKKGPVINREGQTLSFCDVATTKVNWVNGVLLHVPFVLLLKTICILMYL